MNGLPEIVDHTDNDNLSCYFCSKDILEHKLVDDVLICDRIDDETHSPFEYRAWQDVMDEEVCYTEVVHGREKEAYEFRMLPAGPAYLTSYNGLVCAFWKSKDDPDVTHAEYVNHRGVQLYKKLKEKNE